MVKKRVTRFWYDGEDTIDYDLSDGSSSSFRVDPVMAALLMNGLSNSRFLLTACKFSFSNAWTTVYLFEVTSERIEEARQIENVVMEKSHA